MEINREEGYYWVTLDRWRGVAYYGKARDGKNYWWISGEHDTVKEDELSNINENKIVEDGKEN